MRLLQDRFRFVVPGRPSVPSGAGSSILYAWRGVRSSDTKMRCQQRCFQPALSKPEITQASFVLQIVDKKRIKRAIRGAQLSCVSPVLAKSKSSTAFRSELLSCTRHGLLSPQTRPSPRTDGGFLSSRRLQRLMERTQKKRPTSTSAGSKDELCLERWVEATSSNPRDDS